MGVESQPRIASQMGARRGHSRDRPAGHVRRPGRRLSPGAARPGRGARRPGAQGVVGRGHQRGPDRHRAAGRGGVDPRALGSGRGLDRTRAHAAGRHGAPGTDALAVRPRWPRATRGDSQSVPGAPGAGQTGFAAAGDGARAGRGGRTAQPEFLDGATLLLDRRHRGDQPAIQGVRRCGRLSAARVLDAAVRRGRTRAVVGGGDASLPRRDRATGPVHVGSRHLPRGRRRPSGEWGQLVRSGRLRRVRRAVAADHLSLAARRRPIGHLLRRVAGE